MRPGPVSELCRPQPTRVRPRCLAGRRTRARWLPSIAAVPTRASSAVAPRATFTRMWRPPVSGHRAQPGSLVRILSALPATLVRPRAARMRSSTPGRTIHPPSTLRRGTPRQTRSTIPRRTGRATPRRTERTTRRHRIRKRPMPPSTRLQETRRRTFRLTQTTRDWPNSLPPGQGPHGKGLQGARGRASRRGTGSRRSRNRASSLLGCSKIPAR